MPARSSTPTGATRKPAHPTSCSSRRPPLLTRFRPTRGRRCSPRPALSFRRRWQHFRESCVSPATAGQLLDDLQRQAWDLAAALPQHRHERHKMATQHAAGHLAGWPRLAQMGLHALRAVPLSPGGHHHVVLLIPALERVAAHPVKGTADPRVARMADLLGAVGDLLDDEPTAFGPDERDALALRAKILAGIETAGRSTLGFLEQAPKSVDMSSRWRAELGKVIDEAHRSMR